ncbi:MAG: 2-succinyl-5-enolpyruvyl-6-hydroxy-3-cyclohexene-1-carboxylic-acid synthase [Balneolales bacterium]
MPLIDTAGLLFRWSYHLVNALCRQGVQQAFISPGSRSTPLVLALVHHPDIQCHAVLDERSAAYMALGAGKTAKVPALFACTSGTAVANAFPAVVEARMSSVPMIVLSADRPPHMRAIGASQTIDQIKIFGDYPVFFFDTGEALENEEDFRRLERLGMQAVDFSTTKGGPVHINLPFRKPLEPSDEQIMRCVRAYSSKPADASISGTVKEPSRPLPGEFLQMLASARRPLVVAGPDTPDLPAFYTWCRYGRIPVLCETGGFPHGITKHPLILSHTDAIEFMAPDLILRTGGDPVHHPTISALKQWSVPQFVFKGHPDHPDASLSVTHRISGLLSQYNWKRNLPDPEPVTEYEALWASQSVQAEGEQRKKLDHQKRFTDAHVYDRLLPLVLNQPDTRIVLSNSFPIRDYLLFGPEQAVTKLQAIVNRGASGIDGVTSTAIGAALASGKPTVLFTGDLAFLHDVTALNNLMSRNIRLKIVVVNNRGGTIFRMLPFENKDEQYIRFFETPQQVNIPEIARAHDVPFEHADTPDRLNESWEKLGPRHTGILECRTDAEASMKLRSTL